eukprot:gene16570-biopygen14333
MLKDHRDAFSPEFLAKTKSMGASFLCSWLLNTLQCLLPRGVGAAAPQPGCRRPMRRRRRRVWRRRHPQQRRRRWNVHKCNKNNGDGAGLVRCVGDGSELVRHWLGTGSVLVRSWYQFRAGSVLVGSWFSTGQELVRSWLSTGSELVRCWSGTGSALVRHGFELLKQDTSDCL